MPLKEKIDRNTRQGYYEGNIPMSYRYTLGLAGEQFFRKIKEGKLIGSVAEDSETVYCPPRIFCEDSFEEITHYVELPGSGIVESFTVTFEDLHGAKLPEPRIIALVMFDGADGGFAAPLRCDYDEAEIGMRVQLAFVPKTRRVGAITDVYFVPEEEG